VIFTVGHSTRPQEELIAILKEAGVDRLIQPERVAAAVMCAEALPSKCHRQLIADALASRGVEVVHLLGSGERQAHVLNPSAAVGLDGVLVYANSRRGSTSP
jgi:uncharacterized protein (DUF488 family)